MSMILKYSTLIVPYNTIVYRWKTTIETINSWGCYRYYCIRSWTIAMHRFIDVSLHPYHLIYKIFMSNHILVTVYRFKTIRNRIPEILRITWLQRTGNFCELKSIHLEFQIDMGGPRVSEPISVPPGESQHGVCGAVLWGPHQQVLPGVTHPSQCIY